MRTTKAGDVELAIPKLRRSSFFPSILEPRRRIDRALYAVVMGAYVHGVSTRAVDELVEAIRSPPPGIGTAGPGQDNWDFRSYFPPGSAAKI